jgi:hypothetical protein
VVKKYKTTFKTNKIREEFSSQFLFAANKIMQMWLERITMANSRHKVVDSPLNFTSLINSVKYGNFIQLLPPAFTKTNKSKNLPGIPKDADKRPNQKNKTKRAKSVTNTSPFPKFKLLQGETWISNFNGKKKVVLNGTTNASCATDGSSQEDVSKTVST